MNHPFTPTQSRLLLVLNDGGFHSREEMLRAIDELADLGTLRVHLCRIRKVLRNRGENIIQEEVEGRTLYRHVRQLASPVDGRT